MIKPGHLKKAAIGIPLTLMLLGGACVAPKYWIHAATAERVFSDTRSVPHCRVALILGAKVHANGMLSVLLRDRVAMGIELYKAGRVDKLLMSGDNRFFHYNEPDRMAEYAIAHGVKPEDVVMDYAGRRTYDSVYRAKHIFGLNELVVVSQRAHAERAVFLCDKLGVKAYGLSADIPLHMQGRGARTMLIREYPSAMLVLSDLYLKHPHPVMGKREKI